MKIFLYPILIAVLAAQSLNAANSTFSKDSTHVYLVNDASKPALIDINLSKHTCRSLDLGKWFSEGIKGITPSDSSTIYCATEKAVWAYKPEENTCTKFCDSPGGELLDVAFNPKTKQVIGLCYVDKEPVLHVLPNDDATHDCITNRYSGYARVASLQFAADGTVFFHSFGDLWQANIGTSGLAGYRFAPIADLITENTSPASTGIRSIAIGRTHIYACDARMGGSGWGSVIRIKRPAPIPNPDGEYEPGSTSKAVIQELQSVETVLDQVAWNLCSSQDDGLIFITTGTGLKKSQVYLVKDEQKPKAVKIDGLADLLFPEGQ